MRRNILCGKQEAAIGKVDPHVTSLVTREPQNLKSKLISMFILLGEMDLNITSIPYQCLFSIEICSFPNS